MSATRLSHTKITPSRSQESVEEVLDMSRTGASLSLCSAVLGAIGTTKTVWRYCYMYSNILQTVFLYFKFSVLNLTLMDPECLSPYALPHYFESRCYFEFRSVRDTRMTAFFQHDFSEERWRKAALKNAFALLGKQRFDHATAFFLLAGSVRDAIEVRWHNLKFANFHYSLMGKVSDGFWYS